jgi:hypothetical protein
MCVLGLCQMEYACSMHLGGGGGDTSQYFWFGKSEGKTAHDRHKHRWEDNTVLNRPTSTGGCSD